MKIVPFWLTPAGLGLKGKDRDKAEAYYHLTGEELQRQLCKVDFKVKSPAYINRMREIDIEFGKLSEEDKAFAELELRHCDDLLSDNYKQELAAVNLQFNKISKLEYDKEIATITGKPWVGYKDWKLEETEEGTMGFWFDFDWNDHFIDKLKKEGYEEKTDEGLIRRWYAELSRVIALEEGLALDIFDSDPEAADQVTAKKQAINKKEVGGKTEYS